MKALLLLVLSILGKISSYNNSSILENHGSLRNRRLDSVSITKSNQKKSKNKEIRALKLLNAIEQSPVPTYFKPDEGSPAHNPAGPAVFTAAMGGFLRYDAMMFVGSLRDTGYSGDIVVAVQPNSDANFLKVWQYYGCIIYTVSPNCTGEMHSKKCSFDIGENTEPVSINMVRFYMYQWWGRFYNSDALILVSDFRDVFFQSNPFTYKTQDWAPPVAQFIGFQEPYPNKVIYRCAFNGGWIRGCYGNEGLQKVGSNTVSCSGVSIATKTALVIYAYLMVQQLNPKVRYGKDSTKTNDGCISAGMDQGFHNWLLYSGQLAKYVDLKLFQQGEGPVNTVGAFFGEHILVKFPLTEWGVMKGTKGSQIIHNWNGDPSPAVHQADRYLNTQIEPRFANLLVGSRMKELIQTADFDKSYLSK